MNCHFCGKNHIRIEAINFVDNEIIIKFWCFDCHKMFEVLYTRIHLREFKLVEGEEEKRMPDFIKERRRR